MVEGVKPLSTHLLPPLLFSNHGQARNYTESDSRRESNPNGPARSMHVHPLSIPSFCRPAQSPCPCVTRASHHAD